MSRGKVVFCEQDKKAILDAAQNDVVSLSGTLRVRNVQGATVQTIKLKRVDLCTATGVCWARYWAGIGNEIALALAAQRQGAAPPVRIESERNPTIAAKQAAQTN